MVNFERRTKKLDFVIKKKPGGGFSEWLFNQDNSIEGTAVSLVGPVVTPRSFRPGEERSLYRRRKRHCRNDVDSVARAAGEIFRPVQGPRFLRRAHRERCVFLDELTQFKKAFADSLRVVVALSDEDVFRVDHAAVSGSGIRQGVCARSGGPTYER